MSSVSVTAILGDIEKYKFNPARMQRASLEVLRAVTNGEVDIVDATNPFVFCMETTAVNTAAFMEQAEALTRRQYPSVATTAEDLYLHMSDKDYIGRFALPAKAKFTLLFRKDELLNALVEDPSTGIKKITIPRNTVFKVADVSFSLQYPIDIRKLTHGGIQVVYDVEQLSPLQTLETNFIDWEEVFMPDGVGFVRFTVDAWQFSITTKFNDVNAASGFKTTVALTDSFYHIRVYSQQANGRWSEIQTTHTQQVYDPKVPTAVIKVLDKTVQVVIPVVYTTLGLIKNKLRIDLYETRGELSMLLGNYKLEDFSVQWKAIDSNDASPAVAALNDLRTFAVFSTSQIAGGRKALSMEALRLRVINNNVGPQSLPITNVQLQNAIEDGGYEVVKNVDTVTNRIFLATKPMPPPVDSQLITAAASSVATVLLTFDEMLAAHGVNVHYNAVTLTSDALYETTNGMTKVVSEEDYQALKGLPNLQQCLQVNARNYSFTPFHYVLDAKGASFEVRPYYLDSPEILTKSFVSENAASGLQVSVDSTYSIVRSPDGYRLTLSTRSNEAYKALDDIDVFAQLSFKAEGSALPAFMLGVQQPREALTDERVYVFDMRTAFELDEQHLLDQQSFTYNPTGLTTSCALLQEMSVFFCTSADLGEGVSATKIDELLGRYQMPANALGISHEKIKIRFGHSLGALWAQGRSVLASVPYKTHLTDVPQRYAEDVYRVDPVTGSAFALDNAGKLVYDILHLKNDPVCDAQGFPTYRYRAGEPMLDEQGQPVPQDNYESRMVRHADITAIEGAYRFATDAASVAYRSHITSSLVSWLTEDLATLNATLLDQTKIYFYPKVTQGDIRIMTRNGQESIIAASQSLDVTLHVPQETYGNADLLAALKRTTIATIDAMIKGVTTTVSSIEYALRNKYGSDVIDVKIVGFGDTADYSTVTVLDKSNRLSLKKRLVTLPDNQLILEEDVTITFIRHAIRS